MIVAIGYLEKPVSLAFRGTLRDLSIGERINHQRLTLQLIRSLPPNPHPVEVFRGARSHPHGDGCSVAAGFIASTPIVVKKHSNTR